MEASSLRTTIHERKHTHTDIEEIILSEILILYNIYIYIYIHIYIYIYKPVPAKWQSGATLGARGVLPEHPGPALR